MAHSALRNSIIIYIFPDLWIIFQIYGFNEKMDEISCRNLFENVINNKIKIIDDWRENNHLTAIFWKMDLLSEKMDFKPLRPPRP